MKFLFWCILLFAIPKSWSSQNGDLTVYKNLNDGRAGGSLIMYFEQEYNQFIPFCITSFSDRAAELACNQLGYSYVKQYGTIHNMGFPVFASKYAVARIVCPVDAQQLKSCHFYEGFCYANDNVGITCTNSLDIPTQTLSSWFDSSHNGFSRHSSVGTAVGVSFGILITITGVTVVVAILLFIWKKRRRLAQSTPHQRLRNTEENEDVSGNNITSSTTDEKNMAQEETHSQAAVLLSTDETVVTPTAPLLNPPKYSELDTVCNTGITPVQLNA